MTKEENIATLNEHLEHWKRLLSEKICDQYEGKKTIDALQNAIKALEQEPCVNCCNGNQIEKAKLCQKSYLAGMEHKQEPCDDCISRQAAINAAIDGADKWDGGFNREREKCIQEEIEKLPSVTPQQKMGRWIYDKKEDSYKCSLCTFPCHKDNLGAIPTNYCANCGSYNGGDTE